MPIPTQADYDLAELQNLNDVILTKCRSLLHTPAVNPGHIRELAQDYVDRLIEFINANAPKQ